MLVYKQPTEEAPCRRACPAGVDVPRYVRLISEGKFAEALAVVREKVPFPSVCGTVCFRPCEAECRLSEMDGPIAIKALKRFVTEQGGVVRESPVASLSGKRVAVVGSGPAGLTAAYYLTKLGGHSVTVFEALPLPGGMMRVGIPEFRLPRDVLDAEIDMIKKLGVNIKTGTRIDSLAELFAQGYNAIFVTVGAHSGISMRVEGEDEPGVMECVSFLKQVNLGKEVRLGERVAVVGGGNAAIDAARTALRLGAREVTIVYRRTRTEMPANQDEVEEALREGVKIMFLAAPTKIARMNGTLRMECLKMRLGKVDASGRPRPEPISGSEFTIDVDTIIAAIGQTPGVPPQFGLRMERENTIQVDEDTLVTSRKGVFAGGDAVTGPASVIEAIAAGRKAAISIDKYLGGSGVIDETLVPLEEVVAPIRSALPIGEPAIISSLPVPERLRGFAQVELGLTEEVATEEAKRCLKCDLPVVADPAKCVGCLNCTLICSLRLERTFNPTKGQIEIRRLIGRDGDYEISFDDRCDTCGICVKYCPYGSLTREKIKEKG